MKDFFDIYWLSNNHQFKFSQLRAAIIATFKRRSTELPKTTPLAYTNEFAASPDKQTQWKAFLRKSRLTPLDLNSTIERISEFLTPVLTEIRSEQTWTPENGWIPNTPNP